MELTDEYAEKQEKMLREICEPLGLVTSGTMVSIPCAHGMSFWIDASALDLNKLIPTLLGLAMSEGHARGRKEMQGELRRLIGAASVHQNS